MQIRASEKIISGNIKYDAKGQQPLSGIVKKIPVVVHVIHNGGLENISDAQVQSQIDALNEDYRKISGSNGDGNGVDTQIEFSLAQLTPDSQCTNGIVRILSPLTNHYTYQRSDLSKLSFWDNTRYLNIYVIKNINNGAGGIAGYASFPGGPDNEDGIVVRHNYFGRIGTAASFLGRTTTHEIGHWAGLYHPFHGGCGVDTCADGDYVCDTPPAANPSYSCSNANSCTNDFPDLNDQVQNYMDYSGDVCRNMFTQGQTARMQATFSSLRQVIWSAANLTSTGCDSGFTSGPCNVVADFSSNTQSICVNNPVLFTNKTLNDPTSFQWDFPGGTPASSTQTNPIVTYSTVGSYPVRLIASGSKGTDSIEYLNYITVSNPPVGQALPFSEDFETAIFPNNGITIENPDNGITWERDTVAIQYQGNASAKINNLINLNFGQTDALLLPGFDFSVFSGSPFLSFRWAYAKSNTNYSDELLVLVSSDCGVNWTQVFYRSNTQLATGPTQTTPYIPDSNTVWKLASIDLSAYASFSNVIIKIVNVTDGGNNLYIDAINLGGPSGIETGLEISENEISLYPNPANETITITYLLKENSDVCFELYDIAGRKISTLEKGNKNKGVHTLNHKVNNQIPHGIYFIKMRVGNRLYTKKLFIS